MESIKITEFYSENYFISSPDTIRPQCLYRSRIEKGILLKCQYFTVYLFMKGTVLISPKHSTPLYLDTEIK